MWIEKLLSPCWENLQSYRESYQTHRRHPTSVGGPTVDERRVVAIDASCEQRKEDIEIQTQDTSQMGSL